jgi:hypothetical protein
MALKTLSKTNILNGNIVQAADVSQSIDAFTGIEGYAISLSGSFTFSGATTGSGVFQNSVNALSGSSVYIASNASTNANYTLVFKNDTFGLDGFHPLAADGTNGPYYNPSTNVLGGANGNLIISGSVGNFNTITGSLSGSVNGTASFATSASQAITSSYADNGVNSLTVGAFYDTTTQTLATNVSASMTFNSTTVSDGISVASNSRLTVTKAGTYNIQFSSQFTPAGPGSSVYVWLRKNGTNVTYSNTEIHMQNANNAVVAAWNFVETLTPGQYVELIWYPVGGTVDMTAEVPTPGSGGNGNVGIPSVIVTMTQIK